VSKIPLQDFLLKKIVGPFVPVRIFCSMIPVLLRIAEFGADAGNLCAKSGTL
jgi:hypothetical protein